MRTINIKSPKGIITLAAISSLALITSCEKDSKNSNSNNDEFTSKSIEETKTDVENSAIQMVNNLDEFRQVSAIEVLNHLNDLANGDVPSSSALKTLADLGNGNDALKSGIHTLKNDMDDEEDLSVDEFYNNTGRYVYNFLTGEFDTIPDDNEIIFVFPAYDGEDYNSAELILSNFDTKVVTDNSYDLLDEELPISLDITLTYDNQELLSQKFSTQYTDAGIPTMMTNTLSVDQFSFTFNFSYDNDSKASQKFTIKQSGANIYEHYFDVSGDIDANTLSNATEDDIDQHLDDANAHLIISDIKFAGWVSSKLVSKISAIEEKYEDIEDADQDQNIVQEYVDVINKYADFSVQYSATGEKIAEAKVFAAYDEESECYYPSFELVYADGSSVSLELYLEDELDNFFDELNALIDGMEDQFDQSIDDIHADGVNISLN